MILPTVRDGLTGVLFLFGRILYKSIYVSSKSRNTVISMVVSVSTVIFIGIKGP